MSSTTPHWLVVCADTAHGSLDKPPGQRDSRATNEYKHDIDQSMKSLGNSLKPFVTLEIPVAVRSKATETIFEYHSLVSSRLVSHCIHSQTLSAESASV